MNLENAIADALMRGNMEEARARFRDGETLSGRYAENNKSQILLGIFRARAFDLTVRLIESGFIQTDVYDYDSFDRSVFKDIARGLQGDQSSIDFLRDFMKRIQNKNDEVRNQTLLGYCMEEGADPTLIQCMIDEGCNVQYRNNADMNLIYSVVSKNMADPVKVTAYIKLLVTNGVDANHPNVVGTTPLMLAIQGHKKEYLDILLQNGADPNEQDNMGNTAFYYAIVEQRNRAMYEKLKEYAAPDFERAGRDGNHILTSYLRMESGTNEEQLALLLELIRDGADIYQEAPYYGKPKSGADWLAEKAPETLKAVLETGAIDIARLDDKGDTMLHKVCAYNVNFDQDAAKKTYQKVKLLVEAGADAGILNDNDETPLMLALKDNLKVKTAEWLIQQKNK